MTSFIRIATTRSSQHHNKPLLFLYPRVSSIFDLPPQLRTRGFHASPRQNLEVIEPLLLATHTALTTLHTSTGLPWGLTLPLFALLTRTLLTLPLGVSTRRSLQRQQELQPLLSTWTHVVRQKTLREHRDLGPNEAQKVLMKELSQKRRELYKRYKCGVWRSWVPPLVQLPVWLCVIETVRTMCGTGRGILGLVFGSSSSSSATSTSDWKNAVSSEGDVWSVTADPSIISSSSPPPPPATAAIPTTHDLIPSDPTLATEGILWFPDLTSPDPSLVLPFLLSATMFANLLPTSIISRFLPSFSSSSSDLPTIPGATTNTARTVFQRRLTNALRFVALAAGPLTLQVPSGMLLYWISSSALALAQSVVLERVMPLKGGVVPCKLVRHINAASARRVAAEAARGVQSGGVRPFKTVAEKSVAVAKRGSGPAPPHPGPRGAAGAAGASKGRKK